MNMIFFTKKRVLFLAILLTALAGNVYSQGNKKAVSRSAINLTAGFNQPRASVPGIPGVAVNLGYVYVPIRYLGLAAEVSYGTMSGKGALKNVGTEILAMNQRYEFSTQYTSYGFYGMLNLHKLFSMKPPARLTPYITLGASYMNTHATRESVVGSHTYNFVLYANHIGTLLRFKTSPKVDLLISGRYYITQSYFLDGIPMDGVYDNFISIQAGLSYKFGITKKADFIDWKRTRRSGNFKGKDCPRFF
jgi:hypothetical protein